MKKKLLPALLALVMVLGMFPLAAFAEEQAPVPGADGNPVETSALTENKYVTETSEGVAIDGDQYYTVRGWLTFVTTGLEGCQITEGTTSLTVTTANRNHLLNAIVNLRGAIEANENTNNEELKATLAAEIKKSTDLLAGIETLDLSGAQLTNLGLLTGSTDDDTFFTSLKTLDYSGNTLPNAAQEDGGKPVLPSLKVWDTVTSLNLSNTNVTNIDVLEHKTQLTDLNLNGATGLENINALLECTNLKTLDLTGTKVTSLAPLENCTQMTTLTAPNLELTEIGKVEQLGNIENLTLTGTTWTLGEDVTDEELDRAIKAMNYLNAKKPGSAPTLKGSDGQVIPLVYSITVRNGAENANGTVTVKVDGAEVTKADENATVTITATPNAGYTVQSVNVTKASEAVSVTPGADNTYTFTMPATDVLVDVRFAQEAPVSDITAQYTHFQAGSFTAEDAKLYYGGKLVLSGLDASKSYLVVLDNGQAVGNVKPRVSQVVTGQSTVTMSCSQGMELLVFLIKDGSPDLNGDMQETFDDVYFAKSVGVGTPVTEMTTATSGK